MYDIGDPLPFHLEVRDGAGQMVNATVTLTVYEPDGSTSTPSVTNTSTGVYDAVPVADQPATWRGIWDVSGTVTGRQEQAFYVHTALSAVPWRPTLTEVGALTPNRTIAQAPATGDPVLGGTFTLTTAPTSLQVEEMIDDAVAEIAAQTGTVDGSLVEAARSCAKQRAAAKVQRAVPEDEGGGSGTRAAQQWQEASDACVKALVAANSDIGGSAGQPGMLGEWAFPDPVGWGDELVW